MRILLLCSAAAMALSSAPAFAQTATAPSTASPPAAVVPSPAPAAPTSPTTPSAAPASPSAAAVPASPHIVAAGNMLSTLRSSGDFTILVKALTDTNLAPIVQATPDLTLFAPTDKAFERLPQAELTELMAPKNASTLQKILTYHLVHLNLDTAKFKGAKGPVQTVESQPLQIDGSGPVIRVDNADIIQPDVHATNGTIQVIDQVLIPPGLQLPTASASLPPKPPAG